MVAFIQSELQCIVLPNQQIRIEFAGGCQKVSSADERGFPLFTAPTEVPLCAISPSLHSGGPDLRLAARSEWTIQLNAPPSRGRHPEPTAAFLGTAEPGQALAASHFNDRPS